MNSTSSVQQDIRKFSLEKLEGIFLDNGEKRYRARQVYEWLWKKSAKNFDEMNNLSLSLREWLKEYFVIQQSSIDAIQQSADGTIKNSIRLYDGLLIESVLIPAEKRITACVSSQVGCSLNCAFCATAKLKRQRNLSADEIYDQVVFIREQAKEVYGRPLTNIVFMGMGEPLLNYSNVLEAIEKITSQKGLNFSAKRITVSTVGISKIIRQMADENVKFNLAVSLHAAIEDLRTSLMPVNKTNGLAHLSDALKYWYLKTKSKITIEYIVWKNINDTLSHANALLSFCKQFPCKVNLIEFNSIGDDAFEQAHDDTLKMYMEVLERHHITTRIRKSRGKDIAAACGQLANKRTSM